MSETWSQTGRGVMQKATPLTTPHCGESTLGTLVIRGEPLKLILTPSATRFNSQ